MKIAVPYDNGQVFGHFGRTQLFKIYEVEDGFVSGWTISPTDGKGHGELSALLRGWGVTHLVCGGIGEGAREALGQAGIALHPGVEGDADQRVRELLEGSLASDPNACCSGHGHHDHGHDHCGHHH